MRFLKEDTAVEVPVGPIVYASTGYTHAVSYSVAALDIGLVKHETAGAALTATATGSANDMVDIANNPGHYTIELAATNVSTAGPLRLTFNASDILPFWEDFQVVCTDYYILMHTDGTLASADSIVDAWETQSQADPTGFHVNLMEVNGTAQTAGDLASYSITIASDVADVASDWVSFASDVADVASDMVLTASDVADIASDWTVMASSVADVASDVGAGVPLASGAISATTFVGTAIDAIWDEVLHDSKTARQIMGIMLPAFVAGKAAGGGTTAVTFRDTGDGFDAIVQTVDENGNRSTVTTAFA